MGMGGAFIAVDGADENALFYNPAAINDYEKKIHMQFLLPTVEISYKAIDFVVNDVLGLVDDIDAADSDTERITVFEDFVAANTGRYEELGVHGPVAIFMHPTVSAALFYENRTVVGILNPASTTVELESVSHAGLQVGSAYKFFNDNLQAGIALKFVERHLIDETLTSRDFVVNDDFTDALTLDQFGFGIGGDLGVQGKIPWKAKAWEYLDPTLAVTLQDVANTRFFAGDDVGEIKESLTAGFALHPEIWKFKTAFAVDFRDLDHKTDFITKLHAGYEVTWPEISKILRSASVRLGANQGYIAGGFGLDFKYFKLNGATWGREIGQKTRQKQSRMFGVQLAAGF